MTKRFALLGSCSAALMLGLTGVAHATPPDVSQRPTAEWVVAEVPDTIENEIVVDFKDDVSDSDIQAVANDLHITLRDNSPGITDDGKVDVADLPASRVQS